MNTDRDNFYDWHKDRPDTTSFANLDREKLGYRSSRRASGSPWGRILGLVLVLIVVGVAARYLLK